MNKYLKQVLVLVFLITILILPYFVFGAEEGSSMLDKLKDVGENDGPFGAADETTAIEYAGTIIYTMLTLLGVIFISLTVYAGFLWMTDRGNEQSVEKAKKILTAAVIGIILVLSAASIWTFVAGALGL